MRWVVKSLSIGVVVAAAAASSAQSAHMNSARAAAIRECNALASPYTLYTWGNWQLYLYRACMAKHGQIE